MKYGFLLMMIFTLFISSSWGQKLWIEQTEQIKPLRSSKSDVRRILGEASKKYADFEEYETREGVFTFEYSDGGCRYINMVYSHINEGIVVGYDFRPKKKIKFSSLGIDVLGLPTQKSSDVYPQTITYENEAKGINYEVNDNRLIWVQIYPSTDQKLVECPN